MPVRTANAIWKGKVKKGNGTLSVESGFLKNANYSFSSRFENSKGTNPEELIGAAHAGCFSMALSLMLEEKGYNPESIETEAKVYIEMEKNNIFISKIELNTKAKVPNIDKNAFTDITTAAKNNCPVSKALAGVNIELSAELI
ncbi:MAG TPA: OsmC family protein [Candidatus Lokiarchaeia archaeon]